MPLKMHLSISALLASHTYSLLLTTFDTSMRQVSVLWLKGTDLDSRERGDEPNAAALSASGNIGHASTTRARSLGNEVAVHGPGRSEGVGSWRRALVMASVMNSNTLRPCWRQVSRIVCIVSTNRLPAALCVP